MSHDPLYAALQLNDSALPIGRFAHSHGLETLLEDDPEAGEGEIAELVESLVTESVGPLDGVAVAHAHRANGDVSVLTAVDRALTARKLTASSRAASTSCGRSLATLVPVVWEAPHTAAFAVLVRDGRTPGNLAVLEGALAWELGLDCRTAVALEVRGFAAGLLAVPVRLGRLSVSRSQAILAGLHAVLDHAVESALVAGPDDMRSVAPEFEIAAMSHARREARLFRT
jgi:urease accessory protein